MGTHDVKLQPWQESLMSMVGSGQRLILVIPRCPTKTADLAGLALRRLVRAE